jgi:hypothetical protein
MRPLFEMVWSHIQQLPPAHQRGKAHSHPPTHKPLKFILHSGHDTTLHALLCALGAQVREVHFVRV